MKGDVYYLESVKRCIWFNSAMVNTLTYTYREEDEWDNKAVEGMLEERTITMHVVNLPKSLPDSGTKSKLAKVFNQVND